MNQTLLYVNNTDPEDGGGGDRRILEEGKALVEEGFDVHILTSRTDPTLSQRRTTEGVRIRTVRCIPDAFHRLPRAHFYLARSLFPLLSFPFLVWYLQHEDFDVAVDSLTPHPSLLPVIARAFDLPVVALVHEYHDRTALRKYPLLIGVIQLLVQNFLRVGLYSAVVVPRDLTKQRLVSYGVEDPIHIVPNGIHFEQYSEPPESVEVESYDLLVVSRLVHRKGIDLLLDAMAVINRDRPEIRLAIAGSGPRRPEYEKMISGTDIEPNVEFLGYVSEERKVTLLHESDVFVLPSRQEGFGIAVLEAMATGTPVVANDLDILRELLPDEGGAFVDANNPDEFGAAIVECLHRQDRNEISSRVNSDRAESYSWKKVGAKAATVYKEIIPESEESIRIDK